MFRDRPVALSAGAKPICLYPADNFRHYSRFKIFFRVLPVFKSDNARKAATDEIHPTGEKNDGMVGDRGWRAAPKDSGGKTGPDFRKKSLD